MSETPSAVYVVDGYCRECGSEAGWMQPTDDVTPSTPVNQDDDGYSQCCDARVVEDDDE